MMKKTYILLAFLMIFFWSVPIFTQSSDNGFKVPAIDFRVQTTNPASPKDNFLRMFRASSGGFKYKDSAGTVRTILDSANSLEVTAGGDQAANLFVAGPTNGAATTPTWRAIDYRDISTALTTAQPVAATTMAATGAITGATTLTVTGATVLNGGLTMDTNKFTVADATGNTVIAGTAAIAGKVTATTGVLKGIVALTPAATISLNPALGDVFTFVPDQTTTINFASVPATAQTITLIVTTSGTSSYTTTFGTNVKSTGTLASGTSDAKVFVLTFASNGVTFAEQSRTTAQ